MNLTVRLVLMCAFVPGLRAPSESLNPQTSSANRARSFEIVDTNPEWDRLSSAPATPVPRALEEEPDPVEIVMEFAKTRYTWTGDACKQAVSAHKRGEIAKANKKCAEGVEAFKQLPPELQKRCPGARGARCQGFGPRGKLDSTCSLKRDAGFKWARYEWSESLAWCAQPLVKQQKKLAEQKSKQKSWRSRSSSSNGSWNKG